MQIKKNLIYLVMILTLSAVFSGCYQERTKVKFWALTSGEELHILRGLVAKFNYSNPDCELQLKAFKSPGEYYTSFAYKAARKKGPDIVYMADGWIREFGQKKYLRVIKNEKIFPSLSQWNPKIIAALRVRGGHLYCVPDSVNHYLKLISKPSKNNLLTFINPVDYYLYSSQFKLDFTSFTSWINSIKKTKRIFFQRSLSRGYKMVGQSLILPLEQISKVKGDYVITGLTNVVFGCYAVTSHSKDVEESIRFIKFMTEKKHLLRFTKIGKRFNWRNDFKTIAKPFSSSSLQKAYSLVPIKRQSPQLKRKIQSYFGRLGLDLGVKK